MPEIDLDTANTKILALETSVASLTTDHNTLKTNYDDLTTAHNKSGSDLEQLSTTSELKDVEIAKLKESTKGHDAAVSALQAKLTEAEGKAGNNPELDTKYAELTTKHATLETMVLTQSKVRLKGRGLTDELLNEKSQLELNAMETALSVSNPNGTGGAEIKGSGLGSGGGGLVPANTTILDQDLEAIKNAKKKAGVPV